MVDPRFFVPPRIPVTHRNPPPMNACRLGALLWVKRQRRRVPCTGRMQCFIDYYLHCHVIADRSSPSVHTGVPAISTACRPGLAWPGLAWPICRVLCARYAVMLHRQRGPLSPMLSGKLNCSVLFSFPLCIGLYDAI